MAGSRRPNLPVRTLCFGDSLVFLFCFVLNMEKKAIRAVPGYVFTYFLVPLIQSLLRWCIPRGQKRPRLSPLFSAQRGTAGFASCLVHENSSSCGKIQCS